MNSFVISVFNISKFLSLWFIASGLKMPQHVPVGAGAGFLLNLFPFRGLKYPHNQQNNSVYFVVG